MRFGIGPIWRNRPRRAIAAALLSATMLADPAAAQQRSLIRPGDAQARRELRSLEGQVARSAPGAGLQLQRSRRDLISRNRGVAFGPEAARIDRGLDQAGRDLQRQRLDASPVPDRPATRTAPLPSSYREGSPLPSFDPAVTIGRLLGRAEQAVSQGRQAQARSDLDAARSLLAGLDPAASGTSVLGARLASVEAGLGADGS